MKLFLLLVFAFLAGAVSALRYVQTANAKDFASVWRAGVAWGRRFTTPSSSERGGVA